MWLFLKHLNLSLLASFCFPPPIYSNYENIRNKQPTLAPLNPCLCFHFYENTWTKFWMFSLMTFITSPFQGSLSKYLPCKQLEMLYCSHYLRLLDLLYWAFIVFCVKLKLFIFTTKALSYHTPAYVSYAISSYSSANPLLSSTSSVPFVSLSPPCQHAVTGCFPCPEQYPTAVLSPSFWHNWIKLWLGRVTSSLPFL